MESEIRVQTSTADNRLAVPAAVTLPRALAVGPKLGWRGHGSSGQFGLFGSVCDSHTGYRGYRSALGEAGLSG